MNQEICHPVEDDQKLYKAYQENPILKEENSLLKQELQLANEKDKIRDEEVALEKKRGDIYKEGWAAEKDLTDRALKLSDGGKNETTKILVILGIVAIIIVTIAVVL